MEKNDDYKKMLKNQEETKEYSKETIDKLLELIKKERHISLVSEALNLSDFELLGLVQDLINSGINIIVKQYDDGFHLLNQGDQIDNDISTYSFDTDDNNEFSFVAISDVRLGSKSQQLDILNDIYRKANEMGIKSVILCGNISAGLKPMIDTESNFIFDTQGQINYIVDNFPKYEGITTYFISGKLDDKHITNNNINIGKRIAAAREDMVYLGEDICDISIDKVKMQVMNSRLGKTYTASYRTQQTLDAYRSEDKPNILLYGGLLQMEKYNYRDVQCISVPSVCATDKEMKTKRYANTIGAWYITIKTNEKGLLEKIDAINSPYYISNKKDYNNISVNVKNSSKVVPNLDKASIETALKSYNYVKNNMPVDTYMEKFHISFKELQGLLYIWEMCGKKVEIIEKENDFVFKKSMIKVPIYNKDNFEDLNFSEILVVSDTHFGNIHNQVHLLNDLYQEAYNRGIKTVLHVGDLTDGNYPNRPENPRQQFLHGYDEQVGYVADMYPEIDGMTTYYILGSHDETHYKNGQATVNFWLDRCRKDMKFLGQDTGEFVIDKVKYVLDHPGGGSAQALSYKPQKRIEIIESHTKPKILLIGHYHKSYSFVYRNVQCVEVPSLCAKTQFQQKQGLINVVGGYFLKVWSDNKGNIQYFEPEEITYGHKDFWDEADKDKKKVKKLEITHGIY